MREIMLDPDDIPWSYERWRQETESDERRWKAGNHLVVRIVIDPEAFLAWCVASGVEPNSKALERYVFERTNGIKPKPIWEAFES